MKPKPLSPEEEKALVDFDPERKLFAALLAYAEGQPVVVESTEGDVLHGRETCELIVSTGVPLTARVVKDVDRAGWAATTWLEMLEAARLLFMQGKKPGDSYLEWVRQYAKRE